MVGGFFLVKVAATTWISTDCHTRSLPDALPILFKCATKPDISKQFYESADSEVQMSRLIEEILRIEPPVRALSRVTTKAVTVGSTDLPEGAHLLILFASGNDDEAVFECPRHFDSKRENLGKSLTLGSGVH